MLKTSFKLKTYYIEYGVIELLAKCTFEHILYIYIFIYVCIYNLKTWSNDDICIKQINDKIKYMNGTNLIGK